MSDTKAKKTNRRFKFKLPHVYTIMFLLIVVFAVPTAAGEREVAVAGTYEQVDKNYTDSETGETINLGQDIFAVLQAPTKGIQEAADVVAFVLLIGGSFAIITKTNALNAGMSRVIKKLKNKDILIIPITMTLLSICGTTFGMSEEALPFYAIFIPIMMGIGYDSMTAFIICFLGPNLGYCASTIDPFNVLIAQGIIGIEGNPQLWLRAISWVIFTAVGIAWAMRYAMRVKKNPESSITYEDDKLKRVEFSVTDASIEEEFTIRQKLVLIDFACGMGIIVWGLVTQGWYMNEISAVFLGMGLLAGILGGLDQQTIAEEFVNRSRHSGHRRGRHDHRHHPPGARHCARRCTRRRLHHVYVYRPWPALFAGSLEFWPGGTHHARHGSADRAYGPQSRSCRYRAPVC